jgi:hypothetical protein
MSLMGGFFNTENPWVKLFARSLFLHPTIAASEVASLGG